MTVVADVLLLGPIVRIGASLFLKAGIKFGTTVDSDAYYQLIVLA